MLGEGGGRPASLPGPGQPQLPSSRTEMGVSAWAAVGGRESRGLGPGTLSAKPESCGLGLERSLPPSVGWASFLQALDQTPG